MLRIFTGHDSRQAAGWHAFVASLLATSRDYVLMPPFTGEGHDGTNDFTYGRFRVPERCGWSGWALSVDGADMLLKADVAELLPYTYDQGYAVLVAKHDYRTRHPRKYVGTSMESANEDYPRKNWSSVILWNCGHIAHFRARDALRGTAGGYLHRFGWLPDGLIGDLPLEWNWLADEYGENPNAKLLHWTAGQPGFYHYHDAPHADEWRAAVRNVTRGIE